MDTNNTITLYGDLLSQPTRAVFIFLKLNKIKFDFETIEIKSFKPRSEEYSKINPLKKVPAISINNKIIYESHTILRYLAQVFKLDSFYNSNSLDERTAIDTYLDWHHAGLRKQAATLFFLTKVAPIMNIQISPDYLKDAVNQLPLSLSQLESVFLKNGSNKYIAGTNSLSIADISCYCEIKQLDGIQYDFTPYPSLLEWKNRIEKLDGISDANVVINQIASNGQF